jgi:hypothetical protein
MRACHILERRVCVSVIKSNRKKLNRILNIYWEPYILFQCHQEEFQCRPKEYGGYFMKKPFIHVVHKQGAWAIEEEGAEDIMQSFENKEEAMNAGRKIAKQNQVELIVHRQDGSIGERDSYGNDPRDIPG